MNDFFYVLLRNINIVLPLLLIVVGYIAGSMAEKKHYKSILAREKEMLNLPVVTLRSADNENDIAHSELVMGNAVISIDYFKRVLAVLRNMFGGRVSSYESLVDRARREALLRMKEQAQQIGADIIVNFRLETSAIGKSANQKNTVGSVEALAYGTAITRKKS